VTLTRQAETPAAPPTKQAEKPQAPLTTAELVEQIAPSHAGVEPLNASGGAELAAEQIAFSEHTMTARGKAGRGH
jgi:hypothetical protein